MVSNGEFSVEYCRLAAHQTGAQGDRREGDKGRGREGKDGPVAHSRIFISPPVTRLGFGFGQWSCDLVV